MQLKCQFTMTMTKNDKSAIKIAHKNSAVYYNSSELGMTWNIAHKS